MDLEIGITVVNAIEQLEDVLEGLAELGFRRIGGGEAQPVEG